MQCTGGMYSVQEVCTVYRRYVQCTGGTCSVQEVCTVYRRYVQCTGGMCSLQEVCTVYRRYVQCTGGMYSVQELCAVYRRYVQKKRQIRRDRRTKQDDIAAELQIPNKKLKRNMEFAKEKGSSIWLTTLPLEKHGFALSRSEFKDAIALRY